MLDTDCGIRLIYVFGTERIQIFPIPDRFGTEKDFTNILSVWYNNKWIIPSIHEYISEFGVEVQNGTIYN